MSGARTAAVSFALVLYTLISAPAAAQSVESPVPFDSAGKVLTVTPALAQRLQLGLPGWPVTGEFERVRLFQSSTGDYVVVAERKNGVQERWPLTREEGDALRSRVASSLRESTRGVGTQTTVASEPAGTSFVRRQATLGIALYGPLTAAMLSGDRGSETTALAAELFVAGGTFFAAMARRGASPPVTTAQNNLSTWGAIHGAYVGLTTALIADVESGQLASGMVLAGSVGGTLLGLSTAKDMTDAESAASSFAATSSALTTIGLAATANMFEDEGPAKAALGVSSAALLAGHAWGPRYPRRADYVVTAGDVRSLWVPAAIGAAAAITPFIGEPNADEKAIAGALTLGFVGGTIVGDRLLVKPNDHSTADAALLWTGMTAGALMTGGLGVLANADGKLSWTIGVAGAALGTALTESLLRKSPPRGHEGAQGDLPHGERRVAVTVDPAGLIFAAARTPGRFSLVRMTF